MTNTQKTGIVYCIPGYTIKAKIKYGLRQLVIDERHRQNIALEDISLTTKTSIQKLKEIEKHQKHLNWYLFDHLLRYYRKKIEIRLADMD